MPSLGAANAASAKFVKSELTREGEKTDWLEKREKMDHSFKKL